MIPNERNSNLHQVTSQSPDLESEASNGERRRIPRVALPSEQFRLASNGKIFAVADLSFNGMALRLLASDDRVLFPIGAPIEGWLNIDRRKHRVNAVVRNIRGEYVGCEFSQIASQVHAELKRWLDPEELGQALRLMPTPVGFGGAGFEWIWHHGRSGTAVFGKMGLGIDGAQREVLERVVVVLWGTQFVEWSIGSSPSTGAVKFINEEGISQGVFRVAPEWFRADSEVDLQKFTVAKRLVDASNLPEFWKKWVQTNSEGIRNGS